MDIREKLVLIAGILLIISGITHVSQIAVYGIEGHIIGAVLFGIIYFVLGILLIMLRDNKIVMLLGAILPSIGGILGVGRLILFYVLATGELNFFIIFHVIVDIIVVPICGYSFFQLREVP
ncbi:MAG: conserved membrane protein of unknown function [Promethearchaeota archaeon]|nr:MAG: conserved membrane protein of unknown function [Candidatus Lokiarchaeota archaeon]